MSIRTKSWLAWSLWAVAVALTGMSLVLLVLNASDPDAPVFDWWLGNALVVIEATVGALIASRRPENPVGWLLCAFGVAVSTSSFTSQYAIYALLARPGSLPAGEALAWVCSWLLPIIIGLQVSYLALFPTGRLPSRRWRWIAWLTAVFVAVGVFLAAFSPEAYLGSLGPIRNPLGIEGFTGAYEAVLYTGAPLLFVSVTASIFVRLHRALGVERQQLKWFAYGAAMFATGTILNVVTLAIEPPRWFEVANQAIFAVLGTAVPISIGIAILRYRLFDIDVLINRTLVYATLSVTLSLVYLGSVVSLQYAFRSLTGQGSQFVIVASTLVIAALFNPLRRRVQSFVDRRFYRRRYDAAKTLEAYATRLRAETDLASLNDDVVSVVSETMQPEHASLWLRPWQDRTTRDGAEVRVR